MIGRLVFGSLLCVMGMSVTAHADPFRVLPDGSLVFNASYTTQGTFQCGAVLPCSGAGTNTITIGSGGSAVTISFSGVSHSAEIGNVQTRVPMGTFTTVGNAVFPSTASPDHFIFSFTLSMTQTSPADGAAARLMTFGPGGNTQVPLLQAPVTFFAFPTGPNPPGFNYNRIVYTLSLFPFSIRSNGVTSLDAQAGAIPEPATIALMGAGLGLLALARRRRRRQPGAGSSADGIS
jgi:hypothetical protein